PKLTSGSGRPLTACTTRCSTTRPPASVVRQLWEEPRDAQRHGEFGDGPRVVHRATGVLLDPAQSVPDGVGVDIDPPARLGRRPEAVQPRIQGAQQRLALLGW